MKSRIFGVVVAILSLNIRADNVGFVSQSARDIPIETEVDVLVVGGSTAAVVAAQAAATAGASVYLIAPRLYLGEEMCATLRLKDTADKKNSHPMLKEIYGRGDPAKPVAVKAVLVRTLLDAGVNYIYGAYVTDPLFDRRGDICGVIMANRAGRQAVIAKSVIDATDYAWLCRMAGCAISSWPGGKVTFSRSLYFAVTKGKRRFSGRRKKLTIDMPDFSFASLSRAEDLARVQTTTPDLLRGAERLFCVPPLFVTCQGSAADDLKSFIPADQRRLYVLSGMAGVSRDEMARLLHPGALISAGVMVGRAAATAAAREINLADIHLRSHKQPVETAGNVHEILEGSRPVAVGETRKLRIGSTAVPVIASVDVVVVGGGTSGAAAAIAAARRGAATMVIEYQEEFGGVGTLGQITKPYHGRKIGFAAEVPFPQRVEAKMQWYRDEMRKAGCRMLLSTLGCGAFVEGSTVKGAVVCTPEGRGVILADVVIDATGNADVAVAAGANYRYGTIEVGDIALQGTGLSTRTPGKNFNNSDYLLVDENDMTDVSRALTSVFLANQRNFDVGTLILTRERRRIVGDFTMRYIDQIAGRTYPDSIVFSGSNYDSHGYPSSPFFALLPHDNKSRKKNHPAPGGTCYTPYRSLLPAGLNNILVIGLAISMDRDASAMVRMQLDMANQGYAAGVVAALCAAENSSPREVDLSKVRTHLIEIGALDKQVLNHQDSFPLADSKIADAVAGYLSSTNPQQAGQALAVILAHPERALPLLRRSFKRAEGQPGVLCSQVLGVLGCRDGVDYLVRTARTIKEWDDKILQGSMAPYAHLPTPQDSIIIALGYAGDPAAVPALTELTGRLDAEVTLSHHRAVALAWERLKSPRGAEALARLLAKPKMRGYAMTEIVRSGKVEERTNALREITLARALYRCGDHNGLGVTILKEYQNDLRGLFARHANAILAGE
jgi:ribulose 1,5-bisphosphate synthetase/thiazole synthase